MQVELEGWCRGKSWWYTVLVNRLPDVLPFSLMMIMRLMGDQGIYMEKQRNYFQEGIGLIMTLFFIKVKMPEKELQNISSQTKG